MTEAIEWLDGVKVIHDDILLYAVGDSDDEAGIDHNKKLRALLQRCQDTIQKKVVDAQCARQKNQMLLIWKYIHKRIKILHINK
jgi:hypothetical protein